MDSWNEIELKDIIQFKNGKKRPIEDGDIPVYGGNGILGYADTNTHEKCIAIGRVGAYCGSVFYEPGKCWISDNAISAQAKGNTDILFIYYLLSNLHLNHRHIGTGQPLLTQKILNSIRCKVPCIDIQKKISVILHVLDEKIMLNNDINKNLEEQAQALYNELFADSSFDATLADLGTIVGGSTPSKKHPEYYTDQGIAWITPKDLSNNSSKFIYHGEIDITELGLSKCSASVMPSGTVLFSSRAPIGYIAVAANPTATNQGFKSVIPNDKIGTAFVYYFLKNNLTMIESMASGSTFKEVSASAMKAIPAFKPESDKLCQFQDFCEPLFYHQQMLESENTRLAQLRDTLLPRLMSGEVDVSKIVI